MAEDSETKFEKSGKGHHYKDNNFFIFGDIDEEFNDIILPAFIESIFANLELKKPDPINLFIKTYGGSRDMAWEMISWIEKAKKNKCPIDTYVNSHVASAGSLIAVCGSTRYVSQRASHLLHYASGWNYSNNPELSKRQLEADIFEQNEITRIYSENTKLTDIPNKLKHDYYILGGKNLIKYGLADIIL